MRGIPADLVKAAPTLWLVDVTFDGGITAGPALFGDLDKATRWVHGEVARGLRYEADIKWNADDDAVVADGTVTALHWRCPMRRMTKEECLVSGSEFAQNWVATGNHPNCDDFQAALSKGVKFHRSPVSHVWVCRVSRYLGYLERASLLNDKSKDIAALVAAWELYEVNSLEEEGFYAR